jgi:hypothetical protein
MNNERALTCVRCGAPIESGFECQSCRSPRPVFVSDEAGEPPSSDAPRLILSGLILILVVIGLVFGARSVGGGRFKGRSTVLATVDLKMRLTEINEGVRERQRKQAEVRIRAKEAAEERQAAATAPPENSTSYTTPPASPPSTAPVQASDPSPPVDTTITCSRCGGAGMITIVCPKCEGKGEILCGTCTRSVQLGMEPSPRCYECGGISHRGPRGSINYMMAYYTCPECHGTKKVTERCPDCHGIGKIDAAHPPETSNLDP